jgi:hypothetical protein
MKKNLLVSSLFTLISFLNSQSIAQTVTSKGVDITVEEPEFIGNVIYVKNNQAVELEKQKVSVTVQASASLYLTGLGSIRQKVVINEPASPVKIEEDRNLKFIVKVTDNKYDPFEIIEIYRLKKNYKKRSLLTAESGSFSGTKEGDVVRVPYKAVKYGTSSFLITIPQIMMGEYAVNITLKDNQQSKNAAGFTLHLFGITGSSMKVGDRIEYYKNHKTRFGTIEEIDKNNIVIITSQDGTELKHKLDLEDSEIRFVKDEPVSEPKCEKNTLHTGVRVGDKVKWTIQLADMGFGVYVGTKDDKAVVKTTDCGKVVYKEMKIEKLKVAE